MIIKNIIKITAVALCVSFSVHAETSSSVRTLGHKNKIDHEKMVQLGVGLGHSSYSDGFALNVYAQRNTRNSIGWRGQLGFSGGVEDTKNYSNIMDKPFGWHQRTPGNDVNSAITLSIAPTYTLDMSQPISVWVGPEYAYTKKYLSYHSDYSMGDYFLEGETHSLFGVAAGINATTSSGWNLGIAYSSTTKAVFSDIGTTF
ncbi:MULTISPECIES: hypothetical protein [Vibrio]|uniref:hypothetical protein n=1 Tax=Vibrio TaxID=662 RepID=UPI00128C68DB|nr:MULTISPECIES: hypothetical protein [Vibrio]MPW37206.1 hypothetical protein [Vibrio sp. B1Z05]